MDPESILSENIAGVKDPSVLRRILEDRRLLLLSDPSNQEYKVSYCVVLHCIVLCTIVVYCIELYCIVLYYFVLYCIVLY